MSSELIFGLFCLVFVVGTFWLSAVFEGRRRDREQKTQQIVEETSDPRAVVRVLASVRLQASWFIKMLLWVLLILILLMQVSFFDRVLSGGSPEIPVIWINFTFLVLGFPSVVWGLWVCRVSYREILPEKLIRVNNRGHKQVLHYWQIDSSYFTLLGDENGLFELTDTTGVVYRFKPHVQPCRYLASQVAFRVDYGYWADPNNTQDAGILVQYIREKLWVQRLLEVPAISGLALDGVGQEYRPVGGPDFGPEFRIRQSVSGDLTWTTNFVLT